ncbi:MAG: hypothetical protein ACRERD_00085, partial [Candidatus Binatia bacterium]
RDVTPRIPVMLGSSSPDRQARPFRHPQRLILLVPLLLLALSGCYWLKYGKLMRTHIDLLLSMSKKMSELLEDRRTITPTMMNEFSYPLARARDFARIVGPRYAARRSLQAFNRFLDAYAELVRETDRLRVLHGESGGFHERVAALRKQGKEVKTILTEEAL